MTLLDQTLWGIVDKVQIAINRLKQYEPPEGYYLAFSGGKDSCVIKELAKMSEVKFDAHYSITTVDPPELLKFIKKYHPDVIRERPEKNMWQLIIENKCVPLRQKRFCCRILKEAYGKDRKVVLGIRWAESQNRKKKRKIYENAQCGMPTGNKSFVNPIIDWTNEDVWQFIKQYSVPYCSLYDEGAERIGCILCPLSKKRERLFEIILYPYIINAYKRAITKMLDIRRKEKMPCNEHWKDTETMFYWWIHNPKDDDYTLTFNFDN